MNSQQYRTLDYLLFTYYFCSLYLLVNIYYDKNTLIADSSFVTFAFDALVTQQFLLFSNIDHKKIRPRPVKNDGPNKSDT